MEKLAKYHPKDQKAQEIIRELKKMGWVEESLGKGSKAGLTMDQGGGMILREMVDGKPTDTFLQWHPGGGHHGPDPYWKLSSPTSGTLRTVGGTVAAVAAAAIPGVAQASEGDYNGAGRDVFIEFSPLAWSKMLWSSLGSMYDSCEIYMFGEEYHRKSVENQKDFWEKEKNKVKLW